MFSMTRLRAVTPLLVAVLAFSACDNDPTEPDDPADDLETVRLTIGTQTVNLIGGGSAAVTLPIGATTVTATFLDDAGATLAIPSSEFELRLIPSSGGLTFTRTGPFAGTLTGVTAGAVSVEVQLFHLMEQHEDFDATLNVTVQ